MARPQTTYVNAVIGKKPFFDDLGLIRRGHHLYWGHRDGFGYGWLPLFVMQGFLTLWNGIACRLLGHDHLTQAYRGGPVRCVSCLRTVRDPGGDTMVLRMWRWRFK